MEQRLNHDRFGATPHFFELSSARHTERGLSRISATLFGLRQL
jgi:hypothetical protein